MGHRGGAEGSSDRGGGKDQRPEQLRTQVELTGGRSPTESVGRNDEAQSEERSPEAIAGQRRPRQSRRDEGTRRS